MRQQEHFERPKKRQINIYVYIIATHTSCVMAVKPRILGGQNSAAAAASWQQQNSVALATHQPISAIMVCHLTRPGKNCN